MTATGRMEWGTVTDQRLELAAAVKQIRDEEHLPWVEVAARLGISRSYASELFHDPDGSRSRRRKEGYRLPCARCGGLMSGSEGIKNAPTHCATCSAALQHEERYWTPDRIIERFQEFDRVNGRSPSTTDTQVHCRSIRDHISDERIADAERAIALVPLPSHQTVVDNFGSWPGAVVEAGLEPAPVGTPSHRGRRSTPSYRAKRATPPGSTSANRRLFDDVDRLLEGLIK